MRLVSANITLALSVSAAMLAPTGVAYGNRPPAPAEPAQAMPAFVPATVFEIQELRQSCERTSMREGATYPRSSIAWSTYKAAEIKANLNACLARAGEVNLGV